MHSKLVHEQGKRRGAKSFPKALQEVDKDFAVNGAIANLTQLEPSCFRHSHYNGTVACVDLFLVDGQAGVLSTPVLDLKRQLREVHFVEVDDGTLLLSCFRQRIK